MIKEGNKRVMHTLTGETKSMLAEIAKMYGMSESAAINMCVVVFHNFHIRKER